uniref:Uncharacterized protein n=1 Tax=Rhizophora mucronata TaxID=61149 RepID=A0A2P2QHL7_RHIMU
MVSYEFFIDFSVPF